jgi:hypothetical protein
MRLVWIAKKATLAHTTKRQTKLPKFSSLDKKTT